VTHPAGTPPRALIIGGSLGGLFAATTLQAIGWDVDIFERSPQELDSRGGGIVVQAEVLRAFQFAGVECPGHLGVQSRDRLYLDYDGRVISRTYLPQVQTSWNMLYGVMKRSLPAAAFHPGERFERFTHQWESVSAHFSSGRVETGDLLVGADGPGSSVREQVFPGLRPKYAGYVAWRGLVPESKQLAQAVEVLRGHFAFQQGKDHLALEYLVPGEDQSVEPGRRCWNWVWYRKVPHGAKLSNLLTDREGIRHLFSLPAGTPQLQLIEELRQSAQDLLAPAFQELVAATEEPFVQAILDLQVQRMAFGRVVLLGDAAFIPRPHTAGSTAKAAANAHALARALNSSSGHIEVVLQEWQGDQMQVGVDMTEWGMEIGDRIMGIHH
jgi:2-polyprenyl-6-methoxyphenol hydroxylase-like FAD-dependent oxidoreductase